MRYAVLSDIHSNLEALSAVLNDVAAARIDRYLCLGDVIGYGADPTACLARVQACSPVIVGGNHDLACIGKLDVNFFNAVARAALLWTRDQLSFSELNTLRQFRLTESEEPFTLVHGTLAHPQRFDYLVDAGQAIDTLVTSRTLFCLVGHTHVPLFIEYDRLSKRLTRILHGREFSDTTYDDHPETRRYLINPGSVGQPRDGDPRASYAIVDTGARNVAIHRVAYDIQSAQAKIRKAGLPEFLAERLAVGR
jgi:diadenosine tetraphosphatase ApaH/serine/threonine PP2A family protein phosphatase